MNKKVIIAGTGRSGTSFIMALFTELGLDTGYAIENYMEYVFDKCKAGLERSIDDEPYILKNPYFSLLLPDIIKKVKVEMIYIPFRDINHVTESRINQGSPDDAGGLWLTQKSEDQYEKLCYVFGKLISDAIILNIPFKIIEFQKFTISPRYLYEQLEFVLNGMPYPIFLMAYKKVTPLFKRIKTE